MKLKILIKNKFVSSILGTLAVFFGIGFVLPLNNFSVYITSYINMKDSYVTMHHGLFINLIYSFANTFSNSLGGYLENIFSFYFTLIAGMTIVFLTNLAFIFQQNIWICYILSLIFGIGTGISTSLLGKNLTLYSPEKKGIISGVLGFEVMIIAAIYALSGEKIINFGGKTLEKNEDFYPPEIAKRTYIYFLIGEFILPIGLIFALLLNYEYKAEDKKEDKSNSENNIEGEAIKAQEEKKIEETEENNVKNEEKNDENQENQENQSKKNIRKKNITSN